MNAFFNGSEKLEWLVTNLVLEIAALFDISEHGFSAILVGDESINRTHVVTEMTLPGNMLLQFTIIDALVGSVLLRLSILVDQLGLLSNRNLTIDVLDFHLTD